MLLPSLSPYPRTQMVLIIERLAIFARDTWRSWTILDVKRMAVLHTYVIGLYNTSVRIIDIVSYTTYVVCVNFIP